MSITKKIHELLSGGRTLSMSELMEQSGLSYRNVWCAIQHLRRIGEVESYPVSYALSAKGEQRTKFQERRQPSEQEAS